MQYMLNAVQLDLLFDKIWERLAIANRNGSLSHLLAKLGWQDILSEIQSPEDSFHFYADGKIIVLGGTEVKEKNLRGVCKELGFTDKDRFEFYLDYEHLKNFDYRRLQWNSEYRLVLVGPMPHKTAGTGEFNSAISAMKSPNQGYPRVIKLQAGNSLKITKQNFTDTLRNQLDNGFLRV